MQITLLNQIPQTHLNHSIIYFSSYLDIIDGWEVESEKLKKLTLFWRKILISQQLQQVTKIVATEYRNTKSIYVPYFIKIFPFFL